MKTPFMGGLSFVARFFMYLPFAAVVGVVAGCGSGNSVSGGGGGQQSSPDFALSLSTASLAITGGSTASFTASVAGSSGFDSAVSLQIAGLPIGVTYSPTTLQVSPGTPLQITFKAAANVAAGTPEITISGSSGSLMHSVQVDLTVTAVPQSPTTFRTRYTRTDAATEYFTELNENWMVYDSVTNRFFVSDPSGNRIEVLDAATETEIGTISIPGAYGIDEAPDHSVLYAGTQMGDVYAINPATMQVTQRYPAAEIGSSGFSAYSVRVLSNGELALLGSQGGITGVDGYGSVAVWSPPSNSITVYVGPSPFCVRNIGAFTLTGDRSLIVVGSIDSDGTLCTLNPATGQQNSVGGVREFLYNVTPTPDGKSLLIPIYGSTAEVAVYSTQTLAQTATFPVAGDTSSAASMIVSPDSQTLYMGDGGGILYAYNIATGTRLGWMPNLTVEPITGGSNVGPSGNPNLQAFDNTGLLAGPMEEGVGFLDTTTLETGSMGSEFLNAYVTPPTGPTAGGTPIEFTDLAQSATMTTAYLGGRPATSLSQGSGAFDATTPVGSAGPADLYALMSDGGMLIVPEAFSYGPTILEVSPGAATADGGGTGIIYGYGLGPVAYNAPIPADLQITVGGKSAAITGYTSNAYGVSPIPFNLEAVAFTIPPGVAGTSTDVTVTTSSGTATASDALQYLPAVQQFQLTGAALAQGVYDATRDLYYFTDASEIRVFSRTEGQWLSPIQVPAAPTGTTHRLWGIALSPDGSKLAVSDASAGVLYLINPGSPGSVQSFPFNVPYFAGRPDPYITGVIANPAGLTVSDSGMIYFAAFTYGGDGFDGFFKIDSSTGSVTDYEVLGLGNALYKAAITSDNSKVFFNNDGAVFSVDTATDSITYAADDPGCCYGDYDLTLSAGQTTLEATSYLYDTNLAAESYLVLNDRDALNISYVYGTKLSPDGTLLFQPSTNGIDVYDGRLGTLRTRISLPVALSWNYDALVSDGTDNTLIAVTGQTGSGIAIVDLSSLPEPKPLSYIRALDHTNANSLQGRNAQTSRPQLRRGSINRTGQRVPITVIKHDVNGALLNRDGLTLSGPTN